MAFKMKGSPMARNYGHPFKDKGHGNPDPHSHESDAPEDKKKTSGEFLSEKNRQAAIEAAKSESTWGKIKRTVGEIYGEKETLTHPGRTGTPSR